MSVTQSILPHLICAILYAALAFYFWRRHWSGVGNAQAEAESRRGIEHAALLAPFALRRLSGPAP